jgi:hypothetical protein
MSGGENPPFQALPEPATRRLRQYGILAGITVLVIVFAVWTLVSYRNQHEQASHNAAAADKLCRQLVGLGQPCANGAATGDTGVSGAAIIPAPAASASFTPLKPVKGATAAPTDANGVAQAFQPGPDALIVAAAIDGGRLLLTFDDGARVDAGPVDGAQFSVLLRPSASPSPSLSVSVSPSPSPVASPTVMTPPQDSVPEPTWTVRPTIDGGFTPPQDLDSETSTP